jgi:D-glycero-alpha-D-manno-heptose-7-phosphate kinase
MIISRTPLRISFAGGGSDIPNYYLNNEYGSVISCGINKYIYVILKERSKISDYKYVIRWDKIEFCNTIEEIKHPIIKTLLKYYKINFPLEITTFSDIPVSTGLGSSSTLTVGLINALNALTGKQLTRGEMADLASKVEIEFLGNEIGKQDHYAASYGKLNQYLFYDDNTVEVKPVRFDKAVLDKINKSLFLIYLNQKRSANKILKTINFDKKNKIISCQKQQVDNFVKIFEKKMSIKKFGKLLDEGWNLKKSLSNSISNNKINEIYRLAKKFGCEGGKILGAGGGGFLLLYASSSNIVKIKKKFKNNPIVDFKFEDSGTRITYYDQN